MSLQSPQGSGNNYVIDVDSGAEIARLYDQDKMFTKATGGTFPERTKDSFDTVERILDIGCGPGGWVLQVAYEHQDIDIVGIDISRPTIEYAKAMARVQLRENVRFEVMDATKPLPFEDNSFDIVNARYIVGFMDRETWPQLLKECYRITRPGGCIRLTESEFGITSSAASQRLFRYLYEALQVQGRSYSVDGSSIGITHMLGKLVEDAGFRDVKQMAFAVDASAGSEFHYGFSKNVEVTFSLLKPYLTKARGVSEDEFDSLLTQAIVDMLSENYVSLQFSVTLWAEK